MRKYTDLLLSIESHYIGEDAQAINNRLTKVIYFNDHERSKLELPITPDIFKYRDSDAERRFGKYVEEFLFVLAPDLQFYITQSGEQIYHSSLLAGGQVLYAGTIIKKHNYGKQELTITNRSGHYLPSPENMWLLLLLLNNRGVNLANVTIELVDKNERDECKIIFRGDAKQFLIKKSSNKIRKIITSIQQNNIEDFKKILSHSLSPVEPLINEQEEKVYIIELLMTYNASDKLWQCFFSQFIRDDLSEIIDILYTVQYKSIYNYLEKLLLSKQLDYNMTNQASMTLLGILVRQHKTGALTSKQEKILREFISQGANPLQKFGRGRITPIEVAVQKLDVELLQILLQGFSFDKQSTIMNQVFYPSGKTLLQIALTAPREKKQIDDLEKMVEFMLPFVHDVNQLSDGEQSLTALQYCLQPKYQKYCSDSIVRMIVNHSSQDINTIANTVPKMTAMDIATLHDSRFLSLIKERTAHGILKTEYTNKKDSKKTTEQQKTVLLFSAMEMRDYPRYKQEENCLMQKADYQEKYLAAAIEDNNLPLFKEKIKEISIYNAFPFHSDDFERFYPKNLLSRHNASDEFYQYFMESLTAEDIIHAEDNNIDIAKQLGRPLILTDKQEQELREISQALPLFAF